MDTGHLITVDPEILGGVPVFKGTRVPIKTLFEYLENDYSLEEFLECFPSVTRDLARQVLECSKQALLPFSPVPTTIPPALSHSKIRDIYRDSSFCSHSYRRVALAQHAYQMLFRNVR